METSIFIGDTSSKSDLCDTLMGFHLSVSYTPHEPLGFPTPSMEHIKMYQDWLRFFGTIIIGFKCYPFSMFHVLCYGNLKNTCFPRNLVQAILYSSLKSNKSAILFCNGHLTTVALKIGWSGKCTVGHSGLIDSEILSIILN